MQALEVKVARLQELLAEERRAAAGDSSSNSVSKPSSQARFRVCAHCSEHPCSLVSFGRSADAPQTTAATAIPTCGCATSLCLHTSLQLRLRRKAPVPPDRSCRRSEKARCKQRIDITKRHRTFGAEEHLGPKDASCPSCARPSGTRTDAGNQAVRIMHCGRGQEMHNEVLTHAGCFATGEWRRLCATCSSRIRGSVFSHVFSRRPPQRRPNAASSGAGGTAPSQGAPPGPSATVCTTIQALLISDSVFLLLYPMQDWRVLYLQCRSTQPASLAAVLASPAGACVSKPRAGSLWHQHEAQHLQLQLHLLRCS